MTVTSNSEFAKRMMLLARPGEHFEPTAVYDPDGDCIEFVAKPDPFIAERIDDLVTVYTSQETGELTGSLIKGVSKFCADIPADAGLQDRDPPRSSPPRPHLSRPLVVSTARSERLGHANLP